MPDRIKPMPNDRLAGLERPAWLSLAEARLILEPMHRLFPPLLDAVTLSGARMNADSAFLELNVPTRVDGGDGLISFMGSGGPCGGEVYVRMLGVVPDRIYLGQMRCIAEPLGNRLAAIGVNVFGGGTGTVSAEVRVQSRRLVVPFVLSNPPGPTPLHLADQAPMAAFHPINLQNWFVEEIRVTRT